MNHIFQKALIFVLAAAICISCLYVAPKMVNAKETETESGAENETTTDEPDNIDAPTYTDRQGVIYALSEKSCYVCGYSKNIKSAIRLPAKIKISGSTYRVRGIGEGAFYGCKALKTVTISNSITNIKGDAFEGCSKLKTISAALDQTSTKTSGKQFIITVKINGALLCTPAALKLEIDKTVMDKALSDKKTNEVALLISVTDNSNYNVGNRTPDEIVLQEKAAKALADSKKSFKLRVKDAEGNSCYVTVKANDLKNSSGNLPLAVHNKKIADTSGTVRTDLKKALKKNNVKEKNVEIFSYSFGKASKTTVILTIPVKDVKPGSEVYVYRYDKNKRVFAATSLHTYTVSKSGYIKLPIAKGGTFVVTKKEFQAMSRTPSRSELVGKLIVIDAGHQRRANTQAEPIGPGSSTKKTKVTGGAAGVASGLAEYELTLTVSEKLKKELESRGYEVIMCRESHDVNISNSQRAQIANTNRADAFIRIHANSSTSRSDNGVMTICQTAKNPYNGSLYQKSKALSTCILDETVAATGAKKNYVWETDTMTGINWSKVPVTIVEMGYMSNPTEDKQMATDKYQNKLADGIANGIDLFFSE